MFWVLYPLKNKLNGLPYGELMIESANKNKVNTEVRYFGHFSILIKDNQTKLYYKNQLITKYPKVVISRGMNKELLKHLEQKGVKIVNSFETMMTTTNKFKTHQVVADLKIKQPKTLMTKSYNYDKVSSEIGNTIVIKDNTGSRGKNVLLVKDKQEFDNAVNSLKNDYELIFQEFISSSYSKDIRVYLVNHKILGAVVRNGSGEDFRSNISLGGSSNIYELNKELKLSAKRISKALGIKFGSVDFLISDKGYLFCEANCSAGFKAFLKEDFDMYDILLKYVKRKYFKFSKFKNQNKEY